MTVAVRVIVPETDRQTRSCDASHRPVPRPRLDPDSVALGNRLFRRRGPVTLDLGPEALTIGPALPPAPRRDRDQAHLAATLGGASVVLGMPRPMLDRLLRRIDPAIAAAPELHADLPPLLLEAALAGGLEALEARLSDRIAFGPPPDGAPPPAAFRLRCTLGGEAFDVEVAGDRDGRRALARLLELAPPDPAGDDLPIAVSVRAGSTRLSIAALSRLRPGDAVLPDDGATAHGRCTVVFGGGLQAAATVEDGRVTLRAAPARTSTKTLKEGAMTDIESPDGPADDTPDLSIDALEIRLDFELGQVSMPLSEVRTLAEGYVFELGRDRTGPVSILANGRTIGRGELVEIGDAVGVRIVRVFGHD